MGNTTKRIEGAATELGGKIKKGVGSLIGNEQMEAEGRVTELEGEAEQAAEEGEHHDLPVRRGEAPQEQGRDGEDGAGGERGA